MPDEIDSDLLCHKILGFEDAEGPEETGGTDDWLIPHIIHTFTYLYSIYMKN